MWSFLVSLWYSTSSPSSTDEGHEGKWSTWRPKERMHLLKCSCNTSLATSYWIMGCTLFFKCLWEARCSMSSHQLFMSPSSLFCRETVCPEVSGFCVIAEHHCSRNKWFQRSFLHTKFHHFISLLLKGTKLTSLAFKCVRSITITQSAAPCSSLVKQELDEFHELCFNTGSFLLL